MFKKHWILIINLFILLLLLAKNPYSTRTLIPNFEPYPDSIHYIVPARSFAQGGEFAIIREGRSIKPGVPPLYSVFFIPFFMINNDPRTFYFANIFLSVGGVILLYCIIKRLLSTPQSPASNLRSSPSNHRSLTSNLQPPISNLLITFISLFLYVTNYFTYWYPSLAMAENLTLFLFLLNLYLMIVPVNKLTAALAGIVPFCFFITKYANFPLTGVFLLMYSVKLFIECGYRKGKKNEKFKTHGLYFAGSIFCFLLLLLYTESLPGLSSLKSLFGSVIPVQSKGVPASSGGEWFSLSYIKTYLPTYIRALFGGYPLHFLWDMTPIWPIYVGIPGVIGLILALVKKKNRLFSLTLLLTLLASVIFMSAFYSQDMRYLIFAIPTILIGFTMFWDMLFKAIAGISYLRLLFVLVAVFWFSYYSLTNIVRFKKQVMLNLKYAETPWYYLSVLTLNSYFKNYPKDKKEPVVISAEIPYFIDFYSNGEYSLLPLSLSQEFRGYRQKAWGKFDYSDLMMLYSKVLYSGHEVYVHNYGIGNEKPLQDDFKKIQDNFYLTKVADGCFGACNIWKLKIKYPLQRKEDVVK